MDADAAGRWLLDAIGDAVAEHGVREVHRKLVVLGLEGELDTAEESCAAAVTSELPDVDAGRCEAEARRSEPPSVADGAPVRGASGAAFRLTRQGVARSASSRDVASHAGAAGRSRISKRAERPHMS